jgi:hypothetical protein
MSDEPCPVVYLSEDELRDLLKAIDAPGYGARAGVRPPWPGSKLAVGPYGRHITDSMASDDCPYPELW